MRVIVEQFGMKIGRGNRSTRRKPAPPPGQEKLMIEFKITVAMSNIWETETWLSLVREAQVSLHI
jgi:hypothetical protein